MAVTWITNPGRLAIVFERIPLEFVLNATSDIGEVSYSILSGNLPRGLKLVGNTIKGSPTEVRKYTESKFVIRATDGVTTKDRTFTIDVDGADEPSWITREGFLNVGQGENYFVLDNSYVEFQLEAEDTDTLVGDILEFYLIPNGGDLPPGLSLSSSGLISGFTDPVFSVEYELDRTGAFDTSGFDVLPLDRPSATSNGYDSFIYDSQIFDYSQTSLIPRKLSRYYTFIVAVSDGLNEVRRLFRIWVVTDEFLKADNSFIQVDTNLFRADNTSNRIPLWITESYLGRFRANNYITVYLDVYDPPSLDGTITYLLSSTNPGTYKHNTTGEIIYDGRYEISRRFPTFPETKISLGVTIFNDPDDWTVLVPETYSEIPQGMNLDTSTGEIAGRVGYQSAITKSYNFTVRAISFPLIIFDVSLSYQGNWSGTVSYQENDTVLYVNDVYICLQTSLGKIPSSEPFFWAKATSSAEKTFTLEIIGEIDSSISWISDSNLGVIKPNQPSKLFVEAESLIYGGKVFYELYSGTLPPGLNLLGNGSITGKIKQFGDIEGPGITRFYERDSSIEDSTGTFDFNVSFDDKTTSFDKIFNIQIKARDSLNVAESIKNFYITVDADDLKIFANLYLKAFQSKEKRLDWFGFITNSNIFKPDEIYRYGDPNFGVQSEIKMLMYAGIESLEAVKYVQALSRNHYRKQILFGDLKSAQAKDPITQEVIYDVIYVEIVDQFEKDGKSVQDTVNLPDNINSKVLVSYDSIKIDSDIPLVSDSDHQRIFPNSFKNMRKRIKALGARDREFLPLWMRSIQSNSFVETGFVRALTLCYTKPNYSEKIMSRIKADGFDFKSINFTADRYIIDIIDGEIEDKYLAFPQRGEKLP